MKKNTVQFGSYEVDADVYEAYKALCKRKETPMYKVLIRHMKIDIATGTVPTVEDVEKVAPTTPSVPALLAGRKKTTQREVAA